MKPASSLGHTPSPSAARGVDTAPTAQPPTAGQPARQRLGTGEPGGALSTPRPRSAAESLPQGSEHSAATVHRSNARPRARSFDDVVQVRHFESSAPPRNHSGDGEMPLRNAAHLEPPRRVRRAPPEPQPVVPAPSRWADSAEARPTPASSAGLPSMPVRKPDRPDDGKPV